MGLAGDQRVLVALSLLGRGSLCWLCGSSATGWRMTRTGSSRALIAANPLWVARYASAAGTLPGAWQHHTFWQHSSSSSVDQDRFNGDLTRLVALANG